MTQQEKEILSVLKKLFCSRHIQLTFDSSFSTQTRTWITAASPRLKQNEKECVKIEWAMSVINHRVQRRRRQLLPRQGNVTNHSAPNGELYPRNQKRVERTVRNEITSHLCFFNRICSTRKEFTKYHWILKYG